ncbi:hypothetical protein Tco_0931906, partial [Tanacetum coccineum]
MIPQAILMRSRRKIINVAKPKAAHNAVKASTCWVWKPKNRVIDHGGMIDQGEDFGIERDSNKSTDKESESTGEMRIPPVPSVSLFVPIVAATASEKDSTATVITTTTAVTPYTRRTRASRGVVMTSSSPIPINIPSINKEDKGKGIMSEPAKPTKQKEYAQAEDVLSLEDKIELKFLRSHAGWKTKDFKGMTFEQIEETFIPVWESIQDFVPMDSKLESERFKRLDTLLEKERAKRLKTVEGSEQQFEGNKDVKEKDIVKAPIYDWKIFKDKLREVYQIFRVGQAPKAYPYFEAILKEFDRDGMVTLWKLVKD